MWKNNFGQCKGCGRRILWIKTKAGKNMPVDTNIIHYRKDPDGKDKIVTQDGDVVTGTIRYASGGWGNGVYIPFRHLHAVKEIQRESCQIRQMGE